VTDIREQQKENRRDDNLVNSLECKHLKVK